MLAHIIFLGLFYAVLTVIAATLWVSLYRVAGDFRARRAESICWHAGFQELPARDRICRHVFTGEFQRRICDHAFDCRECQTHAALVAKRPAQDRPRPDHVEVLGLEFPLDRFYHRGHAWARPETDGTVTIGLDALAGRLVTDPEEVELSPVGSHIQVNGAAWRMRKSGADVRVLSPADGEVVATGGPRNGWYLKIRPDRGNLDFTHLLRGAEILPWLNREIGRLQRLVSPPGQAVTMADGGTLVTDVAAALPGSNWETVCGQMFLEV